MSTSSIFAARESPEADDEPAPDPHPEKTNVRNANETNVNKMQLFIICIELDVASKIRKKRISDVIQAFDTIV